MEETLDYESTLLVHSLCGAEFDLTRLLWLSDGAIATWSVLHRCRPRSLALGKSISGISGISGISVAMPKGEMSGVEVQSKVAFLD